MSKIKSFFSNIAYNIRTTFVRFPMSIIFLAFLTSIMFILIESLSDFDGDILSRLIFAGIFGTFLSTAVKFMLERFESLYKYQFSFYGLTIVFAIGYYFFMTDAKVTSYSLIHLLVISFALFAAYLYLPSAKDKVNFGNIALSHFKSAFTSILYGIVLYLGIGAILSAVNILLYRIDYKLYAHVANIVFIFFTPLYYLSLLPKFNSNKEEDTAKKDISYNYPKFLDILVSYITIPLITVFSAVLVIYFIKILVTGVWPVGQVGPMVLGYSTAGYFIYILSSNLENKFSLLFRKFFPIVLIPLVVMQMVSSYIRIDAYGITESRYYIVLFGVFSIVCSLMLIFSKRKNPNAIVLLSAFFALISIIPPVDAFTVSKNSQENRLREILERNNMLVNNQLLQKSDIPNEDKYEITNISNYLHGMGYIEKIEWLPEEFNENYYADFKKVYGFDQYYERYYPNDEGRFFVSAFLDDSQVINIKGYDILFKIYSRNNLYSLTEIGRFNLNGKDYTLQEKYDEDGNLTLLVLHKEDLVMEISMKEFVDDLFENPSESKSQLSQEDLTIIKENEELKIKILIDHISVDRYDKSYTHIYLDAFVFVKVP